MENDISLRTIAGDKDSEDWDMSSRYKRKWLLSQTRVWRGR